MALLDYWPFSAISNQLARTEAAVLKVQATADALRLQVKTESDLTRRTMNDGFTELKQNVADAFRENNETIEAATKKIDELLARDTIDPQSLENLNAQLKQQIATNQAFQDKLNPSVPPESAIPTE